jgi:hypothetical protein
MMNARNTEQASVDGFSADWLRLREPLDLTARSQTLAQGFKFALKTRDGQPLRLIDLAAGTGANFRALAPLLQADQEWRLVDHDPLLLQAQRDEISHWAQQRGWRCVDEGDVLSIEAGNARWLVRGQQLDLARDLERIDLSWCDGLVTTAFLDLVSSAWLDRLCALLVAVPRPLLATLSVDGRRAWHPALAADGFIGEAFAAHQAGDKGFGESLGGHAAASLAEKLEAHAYRVSVQPSDWRIGAAHGEMLLTMAREAAAVALVVQPSREASVSAWQTERSAQAARGDLSLVVGHLDLLGVPV